MVSTIPKMEKKIRKKGNNMKQALKVVEEIKQYQNIINSSSSFYIQKDYYKKIRKLIAELKYYCSYKKDVDFKELMNLINKNGGERICY